MGQVLHGSAITTEAMRRAIQRSQESLRGLAKRYVINPKTVATWKQRGSVADRPTGPRQLRSTILSVEDDAIIVAFRRHTRDYTGFCARGHRMERRRPSPWRSTRKS
jgi:hypothetical protein